MALEPLASLVKVSLEKRLRPRLRPAIFRLWMTGRQNDPKIKNYLLKFLEINVNAAVGLFMLQLMTSTIEIHQVKALQFPIDMS